MRVQGQLNIIRRASLINKEGNTAMSLPARKRIITMASNWELANEHYYRRLWMTIRNLVGKRCCFSRREWVDFCVAYFRDMNETVEFQWQNGMPYVLPDWDTWFRDTDARWLSYYLQEDNGLPKMHSHLYGRLRVFDAVIRARWPNIAKRIRK